MTEAFVRIVAMVLCLLALSAGMMIADNWRSFWVNLLAIVLFYGGGIGLSALVLS